MAVQVKLLKLAVPASAGAELFPTDNIDLLDYRSSSPTTTSTDIFGAPVAVVPEKPLSVSGWLVGCSYVSLEVTQATIAAYRSSEVLTLVRETGEEEPVQIMEYPGITRHKTVDGGVVFTIRAVGQPASNTASNPLQAPIISREGPRLFDR